MTDVELARYRLAIKESILHYLCDIREAKHIRKIKPYSTEKKDGLYIVTPI